MNLIRKPAELVVQTNIKALIYGQPGIGKTTLGLSSINPLLLDFDNGVHRINPLHQCDTVQVSKWEDVIEVFKQDLKIYNTIVIDTAGKMIDYMTAYIIKNEPKMGKKDGGLSLQGYGARKVMFSNFLKQVSIMGKHIIFIAHDKEERNGDEIIIRPEVGGSSGQDLFKEMDLIGYMQAIGKKRTISFDATEKYYGKNTCNLEALIEIKNVETTKNTFLQDIINKYQLSLESRKETAIQYNELLEEINTSLIDVIDLSTINKFMDYVPTVNHIWDSRLYCSIKLNEIAKELGYKYNSKEKKYEKI